MKKYNILIMICILMFALGCNRVTESESDFDNVVYFENAKAINTTEIKAAAKDEILTQMLNAATALPAETDIKVTFRKDASLVASFNAQRGSNYLPLPDEYCELPNPHTVIPAGRTLSSGVILQFKNLQNMPVDVYYLLPIKMADAQGLPVLNSATTLYYVVSKAGAAITTAAYMANNYISFPSLANCAELDNLTKVTFEGLIRPKALRNGVNTFMGVEDYCLIRIGDPAGGCPYDQIELVSTTKFRPGSSLIIQTGKWQHIAMTYDVAAKTAIAYLNGKEIYKSTSYNPTKLSSGISLGKKLLTPTASGGLGSSHPFLIGKSYDNGRDINGDMCEFRVWGVVRTAAQIADNMYEVDPTSEGLLAYWKMNEGKGKIVRDHGPNNIHGEANEFIKWISVSLPE